MERKFRAEMYGDQEGIAEVHRQAFGRENEARLVDTLRNTVNWVPELSRVAVQEETVVGHVLFSRIYLEGSPAESPLLALGPIAVLPSFQSQGIGGQLIRDGLEHAGRLGFTGVVVLGHASYYPRFGFVPASRLGIRSPIEVPDEVYMALELRAGALSGVAGTVRYPEPWLRV